MNSPNCDNHECDRGYCPFMTDPLDAYRQVCVKCGQDYSFRKYRLNTFLLLGALIGCIILLVNNHSQITEPQREIQPVAQEVESIY